MKKLTRVVTFLKPVAIPNNLPLYTFTGPVAMLDSGAVEFDHLFLEGRPRFAVVVPLSNVVSIVTDYAQEEL